MKKHSSANRLKGTDHYSSFKKALITLKEKSAKGSMSLKEMVPLLSGKGRILLLIFFSIPFCQIFGLAIPFGLLIAYFGLGYAFSLKPILPKFLLRRKFHSRILEGVVKFK